MLATAGFMPPETGFVPWWLPAAVGLVGLAVAVWLLIVALRVRKLAIGGAIAERISLVVLAVICLAFASIGRWVRPFAPDAFTLEELALASELLVIAGMALMAAYFSGVAATLSGYMKALTGSELLEAEASEASDGGPDTGAVEAGD